VHRDTVLLAIKAEQFMLLLEPYIEFVKVTASQI